MFLSLITSRLAGPLATAVAVALACFLMASCVTNAGLKVKLASANQKLATAERSLETCQANRVTLETAIDRQNAAVTAMKVERDRVTREGQKAVQQARGVAESYRQRAERVLRARAGADQCASADRVILESLR